MSDLPALFISHGAPLLAIDDGPAHQFLRGLGPSLGKPRAIVVISAHWETSAPAVTVSMRPETIHDFSGFPEPLYRLRYPAPGDPELAGRIFQLLDAAGLAGAADYSRGLDHGAWVPLLLMYPDADVPVLQVSLQTALGTAHHLALGAALAPLRGEGVLVIGSGSATHNLREIRWQGAAAEVPAWTSEFAEWLAIAVAEHRVADILDYRTRAPHAVRNHPTEEHFLPLLSAMGAGNPAADWRRVHQSYTYGVIAMDVHRFN